ncbi:MAG: hypothetical protein M1826_001163 [Phylliscum demangeonii]|nr:MAG: hypothetical protein M1826_001163 [Phylliscum demangeonii]
MKPTSISPTSTAVAPSPVPESPTLEGDVFSDDEISPTPPVQYLSSMNFSRPQSSVGRSSGVMTGAMNGPSSYFRSRRVRKGEVEKPGNGRRRPPQEKWVSIITLFGVLMALVISVVLVWDGLRSVVVNEYRLVLDENFSHGLDDQVWTKEVELGGFGNGQFEETTNTDENVFVRDGQLILKPTLQDASLIENDSVLNLTEQGVCTGARYTDCVAATNVTNGTIINPVRSARINTKKGASIRYGRVEVRVKFPGGDWQWPAVWMMPVTDTYGAWPRSGEIDLAESRGNNFSYGLGGNDIVSSALHWGPNTANDAWFRTNTRRTAMHTTFAKSFHTFGLEWSEKYIYTYIDSRLMQVLYTSFNKGLFQRGNFPFADGNGTRLVDPWSQTGQLQTPFDQPFYLILNVAVGGTNGWFADGVGGKAWVDSSPNAMRDFWNARAQWKPTWDQHGEMVVESVKMWQQVNERPNPS